MATSLKIQKVNALPGVLAASTLYIVKSAEAGLLDLYVSSNDGASARHIISKSEISSLINASVAGLNNIEVVANIAARDALAPTTVTQVLVLDATGDATVTTGAATYVYNPADLTWTKISEAESMDVVLQWANLQNKPTSAVADIDDAVALRHSHANKAVLDGFSDDGVLKYNAVPLHAHLEADEW